MTATAQVNIRWKEELVEGPGSFYVKLSPKISYRLVNTDGLTKAVAERALKELQKAAKEAKGKR